MFQFKNSSPKKLAFFIALIFSIPFALIVWWLSGQWWAGLLVLALNVVCAYLLVYYFIESFIYRKIKLIFKFIYNTKAGKKEEMYYQYLLPHRSLEEVGGDVEKWALAKENELALLKKNETYRKEFLQNLSHEFKTPLFAIQGYVETLLDGKANQEVSQKFLTNAHNNIMRMTHLVNDLDEITKLENNQQPLHKVNFIIQEQIREVFDGVQMQAANKEIRCTTKKGSEQPVMVHADKEKIGRVLNNLVHNALNYGKQGGHILAGVYKTDEETVLIEISDNGTGIDEQVLPRIFERFFRTDTGRNRHHGGSGLGLSICKHIIEAHGQNIHARSTPEVGTTIGFTLPLGKQKN